MEERENVRMKRRRDYRRLRQQNKAVSPVVATLILILVAVAAAAALYLWLTGWQAGITKTIGSPTPTATLTIGGSTTVYPYDQTVVTWFQQNHSNIVVSNNQGGSGAGVIAVCNGQVDIGASSRAMTSAELAACPGAFQTRLAFSAVEPIVSATNAQGFTANSASSGFQQQVLALIYEINGGGANGALGVTAATIASVSPATWGLAIGAPSVACPAGVPGLAGNCYAWHDIPNNWGSAGCSSAGTTTCTYGGSAAAIKVYHRADNSGTEETFTTKLLGASCGSDKQLGSCGITAAVGETGNAALLAAVGADPLGLGFNDFGFVATTPSVHGLSFENASQANPVVATVASVKGASAPNPNFATTYGGWRPLEYITIGAPTGEVEQFIQFALDPAVNQAVSAQQGFISIYS